MKKLTVAALLAGQVLTVAPPAIAAPLHDNLGFAEQRHGAFVGARVRAPLGGTRVDRRVRAGLTVAPTMRTLNADGASRLRFGEGLELGFAGREPMRLSIAGTPVNRLAQGGAGPDGQRLGVSTLGWIAIGVGAAVVIVVAATAICASDHDCLPSE